MNLADPVAVALAVADCLREEAIPHALYGGLRTRHLPPKDPLAELQGEMYTFASMLRVVRAAAGPAWSPPAVRAESPDSDWLLRVAELGDCDVRFGGRALAIAVPYDLLDIQLPRGSSSHPIAISEGQPRRATSRRSLQQALTPLVGMQQVSLEFGAELAELSPRTLRRRLAEEGTSWRQVLDRTRFEVSRRRLLEPTLTLAEVAAQVGYADQAHFTRAFHRWTGESPGRYRCRSLPTRVPRAIRNAEPARA